MTDWSILIAIAGLLGTFFFTTATTLTYLVWWLSKQFTLVRNLVYERTEQVKEVLTSKLEYHEKHDDTRFSEVHKHLWDLNARNVSKEIKAEDK